MVGTNKEYIHIPFFLSQAVAEGFAVSDITVSEVRNILNKLLCLGAAAAFHQHRTMNMIDGELTNALFEMINSFQPVKILNYIKNIKEFCHKENYDLVAPQLFDILHNDEEYLGEKTRYFIHEFLIQDTIVTEGTDTQITLELKLPDPDVSEFLKELSIFNNWKLVKLLTKKTSDKVKEYEIANFEFINVRSKKQFPVIKPDIPILPHSTYLQTPGEELISCYPFLSVLHVPQRLGKGKYHLYSFRTRTKGDLIYEDADKGDKRTESAVELYSFLGSFYLKTGDYLNAEKEFLSAVQLGETNAELISSLSLAYQKLGDKNFENAAFSTALQYYQKARNQNEQEPLLHFKIGLTLSRLKKYEQAIEPLQRFITNYPTSARAYELIGRCYEEIEEYSKAANFYKKAMTCNARNPKFKELYQRARRKSTESLNRATSTTSSSNDDQKFQLSQYVFDLSMDVIEGRIEPIIGRLSEVEQIIEVLNCFYKSNALIVGEPGVGKSAIVNEIVRRITLGKECLTLQGKEILQLNVAALIAGARFRGQYEERLLDLVNELKRRENTILFIDDLHTFFNTTTARTGNLDASYVFKPALSRGEIQCIGTTTFEHFRLFLEADPALLRSFQIIKIQEPNDEEVLEIMNEVRQRFESFHRVEIEQSAIENAVELSKILIHNRALPDKAITMLDRACVIAAEKNPLKHELGTEKIKVTTCETIEAISKYSSIPIEKIMSRATEQYIHLSDRVKERIVGQDYAVDAVTKVLRVSRLNLRLNPRQPEGIFLFAGPTGVGKTELALALTELLFGDQDKMIRIDMSEYMEHISTSKLIGIAPGYVGYHDKNQLTDRVRQDPYCLVLLDEIEKASQQVLNLFLQVFDTGRLTDSKGNEVHFENTIFIMTTNLGTDLYGRTVVGYAAGGRSGQYDLTGVTQSEMMRKIKAHLPPEFINRIDEVIFFNSLTYDDMVKILELNLGHIKERLLKERGITLQLDETAEKNLVELGFSPEFGARELHRTLRSYILDPLAKFIIENEDLEGKTVVVRGVGSVEKIEIAEESVSEIVEEPEFFTFEIS